VEAFVNSLKKAPQKTAEPVEAYSRKISHDKVDLKTSLTEIKPGTTLYLPHLYPYSQIFQKILCEQGIEARVLPRTDRVSADMGRKYTLTNEYFSLTALLGDVLKKLNGAGEKNGDATFFIPQNEGAEVDGQYSRFLRTVLDSESFKEVEILSPFVEDLLSKSPELIRTVCLGFLAGDVVMAAPAISRDARFSEIMSLIPEGLLDLSALKKVAKAVGEDFKNNRKPKAILAVGEPYILFNDFLNDCLFKQIENNGNRVIYSPLSEYMWFLWRDYSQLNPTKVNKNGHYDLDNFEADIRDISENLAEASPFAARLQDLVVQADETVGFYAGTNGRYRQAKKLCESQAFNGVVTATSTYENTGIALGVLYRGLENGKPVLNMTFDGNQDENDQAKINSFIHYL
jgi:hypothetical protein